MHGIGGSTLRGGQTVFHGLRMWGQLFRAAMLFAAFTTVAVSAWTLWERTTGAEWYAAGERCVLYDKMGGYTRSFYDNDRDVLMNPLDARAPRWSPFLEARNPRDFDMMAAALIPQQKDTVDPFWVTAARQLFSNGAGVFWKKGVKDNTLDLASGDPQLRHLDCAWASTVHAFQGRMVDTVIAAMEANHPHLTTQKSFHVEISRARDRAELVTDDRAALKEQLEAATGERIAALEAVEPEKAKGREAGLGGDRSAAREMGESASRDRDRSSGPELEPGRGGRGVDRDLAL